MSGGLRPPTPQRRHYGYVDENYSLPQHTFAWFFHVRSQRLIRQYERKDPAYLARLFAEVHAGFGK